MARKKKKGNSFKKIAIVGAVLVAVQIGFILYFESSNAPVSVRSEIQTKVSALRNLTPERKDMMRIQLSLEDFRSRNGKYPKSLTELVPEYFEEIPRNPQTKQAFPYILDGNRYVLGEQSAQAAATKAGSTLAEGGPPSAEEQKVLLAMLEAPDSETMWVYDSTDKRDPFRPFDLSSKTQVDCEKNPLQCYDIRELKLTAVLEGMDEPTANVENKLGRGYLVKKGTKIGRNGGEVVEILQDRIKILESLSDVAGEVSNSVVELPLRTKNGETQEGKKAPSAKKRGSR